MTAAAAPAPRAAGDGEAIPTGSPAGHPERPLGHGSPETMAGAGALSGPEQTATDTGSQNGRRTAAATGNDPGPAGFGERVRHRFGRQAAAYEGQARLQQANAWRLARLCAGLPLPEGPRADLGAGTGLLSRALQQQHRQLRRQAPLQLDLCPELLARNPLAAAPLAGSAAAGATPAGAACLDGIADGAAAAWGQPGGGLVWDLNAGLPEALAGAALLASSFALQWLDEPERQLGLWCRSLRRRGWLVLAVPTAGSFPQWHQAAERAGVPCSALGLPEADGLIETVLRQGLLPQHGQRLRFSRPRQGGLQTLQHLRQLGASASRRRPLTTGQLRRLLRHWPADSALTWEVLLLVAQRP